MSDADCKKRKTTDSTNAILEKEAVDGNEFLRRFIGAEIFDGDYRLEGKMDWAKFWATAPVPVPRSSAEIARFLLYVAEVHEKRVVGSYELQLLLTAINTDANHKMFADEIKHLLPESSLGEKMQKLITAALDNFTTYVIMTNKSSKPRPCLRYMDFQHSH